MPSCIKTNMLFDGKCAVWVIALQTSLNATSQVIWHIEEEANQSNFLRCGCFERNGWIENCKLPFSDYMLF